MAKIIRLNGAGASGASGSGTSPASLHLSFSNSAAIEGTAYQGELRAVGGVQPYTFAILGLGFPPGLTLDTSTGEISGTPTVGAAYVFIALVTDFLGTTDSVLCSINVALASGSSVTTATIASVTGREVSGTDVADPVSRVVSFQIGCELSFSTFGPVSQYCTIYKSRDGGSNWIWVESRLFLSDPQEVFFYEARPAAGGTYELAAVAGAIKGDPSIEIPTASLPADCVFSATFAVSALALPSATLGTAPAYTAGGAGSWPFNAITEDNVQYFKITGLTINTAGAFADPNDFVITSTFTDLDKDSLPIGPEHVYQSVIPVDGVIHLGELIGAYGTDGTSYVRTGNIAYVRWKVIASNRYDQTATAWTDFTHTSTRQTDVTGGLGYVDIVVAVGGVPAETKIVNTDHAANFGIYSKFLDPNFDQANPGLVSDPGNALWGPGYLGSAIWLTQIPAPGIVTVYSGGYLNRQYVGLKGAAVQIGQLLSVVAGHAYFFSVATESTNTGGSHALKFVAQWVDGSGGSISTSTVTIASGYVSAWAVKTGYITAPAGAAMATIYFSTDASEPSAGEWYITTLQLQDTLDQSANNQRSTSAPLAGAVDYSALRAISEIDASDAYYGRQECKLTGPGGSNVDILVGSGGVAQVSIEDDTGANGLHFAFSNAGIAITVLESGVAYSTYSGTMSSASAANKPIKHGFVVF